MEKTKEGIIRYCFTKYVETALDRARRDYMKKDQRRNGMEVSAESELLFSIQQEDKDKEGFLSQEMISAVPWRAEAIKSFLKELVDERMLAALSYLTDTELLIVFAKVFRQMAFRNIAEVMGGDWKKVASSYSYARKKLRKGWEQNGI